MNKNQCDEIYDNYFIELYLSEELEENKIIEFEKHVKECDRCKKLLNDEKIIIDTINLEENLVIPPSSAYTIVNENDLHGISKSMSSISSSSSETIQ